MCELDVGGGIRDEQSPPVPDGRPTHEAAAGDGGVYDGDVVAELGLEHRVEGLGPVYPRQAVSVGEGGEDADLVGVLE